MWLVLLVVPLFVILLAAGIIAGGVYSAVLLPIAGIILVGAVIYTMWGRSTEPENIPGERERVKPLPHTDHRNTGPAPSTPDQLVDARRAEQ